MPAPTVSASYASTIRVVESSQNPFVDTSDPSMIFSGLSEGDTFTASTTITASKHAVGSKALSSGTATIDLTAVVDGDARTIDFTGLKMRIMKFSNPSTNANSISVTFGASTPYAFSGADYKFTLAPGQSVLFQLDTDPVAVSGSLKSIDISGTLAQTLNFHFIGGA